MPSRTQRSTFVVALGLWPLSCGDDFASDVSGQTDGTSTTGLATVTSVDGTSTDSANPTGDESGTTGVESGPVCGNGLLEADEQCDDGNLVSDDGCSKRCRDEFCGDGVVQAGEACDLGPDNADDGTCTAACSKNVCGDGLQGPAEGCDDGNTDDGDGCGADCTLETCGNGEVEAGETCDDGNADDDDGCTTLCAPPVCGDGLVSPSLGENCDDANPDDADACPNDCTEAVCGDGLVEGLETCDEGDANGDGVSECSPQCTLNVCGDGYLLPGVEVCDDGVATGDGNSPCSPQCALNVCGDAYHHLATEGCDAGERNGFVPCNTNCQSVPEVVEIALARGAACARYADGSVRCWGQADSGGLGIEPPPDDQVGDEPGEMPPPVATLGGPVISLAGTYAEGGMCAVRASGEVICWGGGQCSPWEYDGDEQYYGGLFGPIAPDDLSGLGYGSDGLSIGEQPGELPPSPIPLGVPATRVSGGSGSACIIGSDATLRCWGGSEEGPWPTLGYGALRQRVFAEHFPPPPVNLGVNAVAVLHQSARTCIIGDDALLRCFGLWEHGSLGLPGVGPVATGTSIPQPPPVELGTPVTQVDGNGGRGACAVGTDGTVRCFGQWYPTVFGGEIVGDDPGEMPPAPVDLGPDDITKVVVGAYQVCALSEFGDVRCWGGPPSRTLGYPEIEGAIGDQPGEMPPPVLELSRPAANLFANSSSPMFCAILDDHSVECWGRYIRGLEMPATHVGDQPGEMPPPALRLYQ